MITGERTLPRLSFKAWRNFNMANSKSYPFQFNVEDDILIKYEGYDSVVEIPDGIIAIENKAFWYNKFITKVTLPDTVKAIGNYAFCGCQSLAEINIPSGTKHIGKMAFNACTKLTEIEIPESVLEIGAQAFGNCTSLDSVVLAAVKKLPQCVFANCKSLEYLQISEGTEKIGDAALYECDSLETVVIPSTVNYIGESALLGCDNLEEIHYLGTEKEYKKVDKADDFADVTKNVNIEFVDTPAPEKKPEPEPAPAPAKKEEPAAKGMKGDTPVTAPFPGTVLSVKVSLGQYVKKDEILCSMEAMKMENDIPAPKDGIVASINAPKGTAVNASDVLITLNAISNPTGINIGDRVVISDSGQRYSSYVSWFDDNAPELKSQFTSKPLMSGEYVIRAMGSHSKTNTSTIVCAIESVTDKSIYLLGSTGLKKVGTAEPAAPKKIETPEPKKAPSYTSNSTNNPNGVKIGDTVVVSDSGQRYPNYSAWFDDNAPELKSRFSTGELPGGEYKILAIAHHSAGNDTLCCAIEKSGGKVYLVGAKGLKKPSAASYTSNSTNNPLGLKVGDTVQVSDPGKQYSTYASWLDSNAPSLKSKFVNDRKVPSGVNYKIAALANHSVGNSTLLAAIENGSTVFIMGVLGLRRSTGTVSTESYTLPTDMKAGDTVIVTDDMQRYTTYTSWFDTYAPEYRSGYAYKEETIPKGTFTLMKIAPHTSDSSVFVCCLKHSNGKYYLIQKKGVAKATGSAATPAKTPSYTSNSTNNPNGVAIGDTVVISNSGQRYPSYSAWFDDNAPHLKSRFAKDKELVSGSYTVLTMGMHTKGSSTLCCAIESVNTKDVYLIGATGVKKATTSSYSAPKVVSNSTNNPNGVAVGDTVIVYDSGKRYSSYSSWFTDNAPHLASRFAKDKPLPSGTFKILEMAYHSKGSTTICCAIENTSDKSVHLIGAAGLKKSAATSSFTSSGDFNPGDTVIVTDAMQRYPTYNGWFDAYAPEYKSNFAYDQPIPSGTFTFMKMAPHTSDKSVYVCCLKHNGNGKYYLVQKKGVAKASGGSATTYKAPSYTSNSTNNPNGVAIGDTVVISNSGQRYPSYSAWFDDNAPHLKSRFAKDKELVSGNYTVLTMGMHTKGSSTLCCAIESVNTKDVYLIGATGIKKAGGSSFSTTSSFGGTSFGNLTNNPNGLRVGDTVVVTNSGKQYTTYSSWFDKYASHLKSSFAYSVSINTSARYEIVAAAPHSVGSDTMVCAVKSKTDGRVYLIGALGIKRA